MQEKNRPRKNADQGDTIVSDGMAKHHFPKTKGHSPGPKQYFLFDELYRADDFPVCFSTQGDTSFALG